MFTERQTQVRTEYVTSAVAMVQTVTVDVPQASYITTPTTQVNYVTVDVTVTRPVYRTVTQCYPQQQQRYRRRQGWSLPSSAEPDNDA